MGHAPGVEDDCAECVWNREHDAGGSGIKSIPRTTERGSVPAAVESLYTPSQGGISGATGLKFDDGKRRVGLIPVYPLLEIANVYTYGARERPRPDGSKGYGDHNWRGGLAWSRVYDAVLRHLLSWAAGEDLDKESGHPHLAHASFGLMTLLEFSKTRPELDDRPKDQAR